MLTKEGLPGRLSGFIGRGRLQRSALAHLLPASSYKDIMMQEEGPGGKPASCSWASPPSETSVIYSVNQPQQPRKHAATMLSSLRHLVTTDSRLTLPSC